MLVTISEYARGKGVARLIITRLVNEGRLTTVNGKINPEVADKQAEGIRGLSGLKPYPLQRDEEKMGEVYQISKKLRVVGAPAESDPQPDYDDKPSSASYFSEGSAFLEDPGITLQQAATVKEAYRAKLNKLQYEKDKGKLVPIDQVKKDAFEAASRIREAFLVLPERISPMLEGKSEPEIRNELRKEIRSMLATVLS